MISFWTFWHFPDTRTSIYFIYLFINFLLFWQSFLIQTFWLASDSLKVQIRETTEKICQPPDTHQNQIEWNYVWRTWAHRQRITLEQGAYKPLEHVCVFFFFLCFAIHCVTIRNSKEQSIKFKCEVRNRCVVHCTYPEQQSYNITLCFIFICFFMRTSTHMNDWLATRVWL